MFWAERYARIKDRKLSYYEDKNDTVPRATLGLSHATLIENVNGRDDLFQLKLKSGPIASIYLKIENKSFQLRFISCLKENIRAPDGPMDQQPSCDLEEANDIMSKLPDLPTIYQYVFEDKYVVKAVEGKHISSQLYHKKQNKEGPLSRFFNRPLTVWHALSLFVMSYYCIGQPNVILAMGAFLVVFGLFSLLFRQIKYSRYRQSIMVNQSILDILYTLKHKRQNLYSDKHHQIEFHQAQFKGDNKIYLVETTIDNKLKYMWEVCGFGNESIINVYYDSHSPQIHVKMLPMLVGHCRIEEALKGLTEPTKQLNTLLSIKEDNVLGKMDSLGTSSPAKGNSTAIDLSSSKIMFLPPLQELSRVYPDVPKQILNDMVLSRERFLSHINTKWESMESKNGCNMYVKDIDGNLATKGQTTFKGAIQPIVQYILDIQKRPQYDQMYNSGKIIKDFGAMGIVYQKFNGIFPVKARDFVILLSKQKTEKGQLIHVRSIKYDYPLDPKSVRAIVLSGGFELKQVEPGIIRVTYVTETDLCGDLPGIVRRTAGKMQSGVIIKFRQAVTKRFK